MFEPFDLAIPSDLLWRLELRGLLCIVSSGCFKLSVDTHAHLLTYCTKATRSLPHPRSLGLAHVDTTGRVQAIEYAVRSAKAKDSKSNKVLFIELAKAGIVLAVVVGAAVAILFPMGYFGPLGARIRGLFVKHTRTGNPLVDSVAEHQPANEQAYKQYLHHIFHIAPVGFALLAGKAALFKLRVFGYQFARGVDAPLFLVLYGATAYYFCTKVSLQSFSILWLRVLQCVIPTLMMMIFLLT